MDHPFTFLVDVFGVDHHSLHVVTALVVVGLLTVIGLVIMYPRIRDSKKNFLPEGKTSLKGFIELFMDLWVGLCEDIIGHGGRKHLPFVGSIFFFIFFSNLIGLIPGFLPPTENWVTGAAVATVAFLGYNYIGFKEAGIGYLKHFLAPVSAGPAKSIVRWVLIMLPILLLHVLIGGVELISHAFRPITLSIRLYANIFADHMVLGIFSGLVPYLIPIPFLVLGIFVSFMQAFIFTLLTVVYISGAAAHEH